MINVTTNIKIAIAGCGSAGRKNIRAFLKIDEVEIVACCDEVEDIASFTAKEFGIPAFFTDIDEMIKKLSFDALIVALPDTEHFRAVLKALSEGINVFCENPLAANYEQAVEMTRVARESGLVAMVNDPIFYSPIVSSALKYIKETKFGPIRYIEASIMQNRLETGVFNDPLDEKRLLWRLSSSAGAIGAIGELGYSLFNIVANVCGGPKEISSMISNISGFDEVEEYSELDLTSGDTFSCSISFDEKCAGIINGTWFSGAGHDQLTVTIRGENAVLGFDTTVSEQKIIVYKDGKKESISIEEFDPYLAQELFISAIKRETALILDFDHALKIQYYIEQSRLSSEGGLKLNIE